MFAPFCPVHGSRVLLFAGNIRAIRNSSDGIEVHYRCTCGHEGVWRTGRSARAPGS